LKKTYRKSSVRSIDALTPRSVQQTNWLTQRQETRRLVNISFIKRLSNRKNKATGKGADFIRNHGSIRCFRII